MTKENILREIYFLMGKLQQNIDLINKEKLGIIVAVGNSEKLNGLYMAGSKNAQMSILNTALKQIDKDDKDNVDFSKIKGTGNKPLKTKSRLYKKDLRKV